MHPERPDTRRSMRRAGLGPRTHGGPLALLLGAAALAACGVDDAPTAPKTSLEPDFDLVSDELSVADAETKAEAGVTASGLEVVELGSRAELEGLARLGPTDVVVTWKQAGGIEPEPFVVAIPAECFVDGSTDLIVEDFRECGVSVTLGGEALDLLELEVVLSLPPDPIVPARFDLSAVVHPPDPIAPVLLGVLGGAVVEVAIGEGIGSASPLEIKSVSGVDPQPFSDGQSLSVADAETKAEVGITTSGLEAVGMGLHAELHGLSRIAPSDVVVTWKQEGGVEPEPFVVAIPAECFVDGSTDLVVEDFRGCGVRVTLGGEALDVLELEVVLSLPPDPIVPALLDLSAVVIPPDPVAPEVLLGVLGGAVVEVVVGEGIGSASPLETKTLSGIDPEPL